MEQPSSDNATAVVADNPTTSEPASSPATTQVTPTPQPAEVQAEAFSNIDPSKLPPELKGSYDSMLSDYRKKTAEIASQRKEFESYSEKAKQFDVLASDPDIVAMVNKKYAPHQNVSPYNDAYIDPVVAERLSKLESELTVRDARLVVKDFQSQHTDFNDYKDLVTGYVQLNPPKNNSEKEMQRVLEAGYNYFRGLKEQWRGEGKKEGLQRVAEKASQSTLAPSPAVPGAFTGEAKKLSVSEAVELAKKGQRVNAGQW